MRSRGVFAPVWSAVSWPLLPPAPTPTLTYVPGEETVGTNGALFYVLFFIGAVLFLLAFFYGRRKG